MKTNFTPVRCSLSGLLGREYVAAAVAARARLTGESPGALRRMAETALDFFPRPFQRMLIDLIPRIGTRVTRPLAASLSGATSAAFAAATHRSRAPLSALGWYRVAEDGRLHCISKSEHYHASLGHAFPGYQLVEHARRLGIPNATHNNTRGHITRLLEEELVRTANGIAPGDAAGLARALRSKAGTVLNRVLNLETGSLVAEAALKMMLARFYRIHPEDPPPKYTGRTPVLLVLGDDQGGVRANYHGTTVLAQMLRGMWPELGSAFARHGIMKVAALRPNNMTDLEAAFARDEHGREKIAGFCHELVLMNYGGRLLDRAFIRRAYQLCRAHDVPTFVDEIQSCMWSPQLYLFREYGLRPAIVAVGKGFPGGEYPAARIIFASPLDCLPQFGALVTNGQEELAALAYLVTMRWAAANRAVTQAVGAYYEQHLRALAAAHPRLIHSVDGLRHLCALRFHAVQPAKAFAAALVEKGYDSSVQTYKTSCPPAALTKLPLIAGYELVDAFVAAMDGVLQGM